MNKFMQEKLDGIEKESGFEGLERELKREELYVSRMRSDKTYANDKAMQDTLTYRQEYIDAIKAKLKNLTSGF